MPAPAQQPPPGGVPAAAQPPEPVDPEKERLLKEAAEEQERRDKERRAKEEEEERIKQAKEAEKKRQEDCLHQFKLLLLEKGVTPGGSWEKELPKFCFDPRYKELLPNPSDRKAAFESFTRADVVKYKEEARKLQAERRISALEAVKEMLDQGSLSASVAFDEWWAEREDDPRLEGLMKNDKKLKQMFDEAMEPVIIAAKEEAVLKQVEQKVKFQDILKGDSSLTPNSSWTKYRKQLEKMLDDEDEEDKADDQSEGEVEGIKQIDMKVFGWSDMEKVFRQYLRTLGGQEDDAEDKEDKNRADKDRKDKDGHRERDRERDRESGVKHRERDSHGKDKESYGKDRDRDRRRDRDREDDRRGRDRDSRDDRNRDSRKRKGEEDGDKSSKRHKGSALDDFKVCNKRTCARMHLNFF